jgi:hypothetical protein
MDATTQFIAGLGSAAAWPVGAQAQQALPESLSRVGYLSPASAHENNVALFDAFRIKLIGLC